MTTNGESPQTMALPAQPRSSWSASLLDGSRMTRAWTEFADRFPLLAFLDSCLRAASTAVFVGNSVSGLIIFVGIGVYSRWLLTAAVIGVVSSTATAWLFGFPRDDTRSGLLGFNGILVGCGLATFQDPAWSAAVIAYIVAGGVAAAIISAALLRVLGGTWRLPFLTLPLNAVVMLTLLAGQTVRNGHLSSLVAPAAPAISGQSVHTTLRALPIGPGSDDLSHLVDATLHGMSQLFYADSAPAAIIFLIAIAIGAPRVCLLAILGSIVGLATAFLLGANGFTAYLGLWGLNGFLTCAAVGAIFLTVTWRSALLGICGAALATLGYAAVSAVAGAWGLPAGSLPYCAITLTILLAAGHSTRVLPKSLTEGA